MSANGQNYYLDNKGTIMPPEAKCVALTILRYPCISLRYREKKMKKAGLLFLVMIVIAVVTAGIDVYKRQLYR